AWRILRFPSRARSLMMCIHAKNRVSIHLSGKSMRGARQAPAHGCRGVDVVSPAGHERFVIGAIAGDERRRRYGERIAQGYTWLVYDTLDLLPHLLAGVDVEAVVVDLLLWA